jgi:glycosyltransferase involved in cell wall biosynthesis
MRICLVYDCLFPYTVGGGERWYRSLAERLAAEGHDVTYLTLRQWPRGEAPDVPGVRVVAVGPRMALYQGDGRRRILPPLVFGAGVLAHLARHGRRFDVVQTVSFPYFSLLAAAAVRPLRRFRLIVDWLEVWTREYWREYLGQAGGAIGWWVQRRCVRIRQRAFCLAELTARRLREEGLNGEVTVLAGVYTGRVEAELRPSTEPPTAVYAGRHIPEKRVPALVPAIAVARRRLPTLRGTLYGDGPERNAVLAAIARERLEDAVSAPGFVSAGEIEAALGSALCMVLPSRREGFGLVVVEAASHGTPSVVVAGPDNAAVELIEEGVNGFVAASAEPDELAAAILRVHEAGSALRASTAAWFDRNARRLDASLDVVAAAYGEERTVSARS